jgi:acyl-coenzyme A thioesterase PaaI-like protein
VTSTARPPTAQPPTPPSRGEQLASAWFPASSQPSATRQRKHALAARLRKIAADFVQLDIGACSTQELDALEAEVAALSVRLSGTPSLRRHGSSSHAPGDDGLLFERSPITGRSNPLAAPLVLRYDGELTHGHATFTDAYEGPPGTVHGGHVIAAFDDLLGVAQIASGDAGMTGTLSVRLHAPTPLWTRIDYTGGVDRLEGRKIFAWGRSFIGDRTLAEATGIFIAARRD